MTRQEWDYMNDLTRRDWYVEEKIIPLLRSYRLRLLDDESQEILPDMTYMLTPGHTPGCMAVVLHNGCAGNWVLCGDAAKNRSELRTRKVWMTQNPAVSERSLERILAAGDRYLPGHDCWIRKTESGALEAEGKNELKLIPHTGITLNDGCDYVGVYMDGDLE